MHQCSSILLYWKSLKSIGIIASGRVRGAPHFRPRTRAVGHCASSNFAATGAVALRNLWAQLTDGKIVQPLAMKPTLLARVRAN